MNGYSINGIVDTQLDEDTGKPKVKKASDEASDDGRPWLDEGTAGGDANEATETAIHGIVETKVGLAGLAFHNEEIYDETGNASSRGCKGSVDTGEGSDFSIKFG